MESLKRLLPDFHKLANAFAQAHPEGPTPENLKLLESMANELVTLAARCDSVERTKDSLITNLLREISNTVSISGMHDFDTGIGQITKEYAENPTFKKAIDLCAEVCLKVFPVESKDEVREAILAFNRKHSGQSVPKPAFKLFQGGINEEETETQDQPLLH